MKNNSKLLNAIIISSIFLFGSRVCVASPSSEKDWGEWLRAKSSYDSQKYEDALEVFKEHPKDDASYHYNLGTVYFKLGKFGASLAHLEKANRMHPHDSDIQHNLSLVRNRLTQLMGADKLDPASTLPEQIADRLSLDEIRTALGLLGMIAVILWIRNYLKTHSLKNAILSPTGLFALTGFIVAAGVYGIQRWADAYPPAICLQKEPIRSGPGEHYIELSQTEEGSKLRLLGPTAQDSSSVQNESETWHQVRYSGDGIGWVKSSCLLVL